MLTSGRGTTEEDSRSFNNYTYERFRKEGLDDAVKSLYETY